MADQAALHGRSVLLVEDDVAVAQMYKLKLELDGYLVLTAVDGETGLAMAEKFHPNLIVLDIRLPGMDGLALMDAMRARDRLRETPILILTSVDDPDTERRSVELGARQYLLKSKTTPGALAGWVARSSGAAERPIDHEGT
jgi:DNA-binding response OmpR family regulator